SSTVNSTCGPESSCTCQAGFWNYRNQECRPEVVLGGGCLYQEDCSSHNPVTVCEEGLCSCPSVTVDNTTYRLAGGPDVCSEGRVELRAAAAAAGWHHVCDDFWETEDATVLCRSLGFSVGTAVCCSLFGFAGTGALYAMDDVACLGAEPSLMACAHLSQHNCDDTEVAAVRCA
ncbi:scavenger receptor cysteine-rich domain-containing group B protein-like, partial [Amphibalanus amphitrite]|uniref:scavenger receptor cysteine-rich domain-containing group B protein-like n=1 Tax=Amphibalanus amphitrite TaxID=1232801 RepID=UPI001C90078D